MKSNENEVASYFHWVVRLSLFVLLTIGAITYWIYNVAQFSLLKQVSQRLESVARDRDKMTQMIIYGHKADLKLLVENEEVENYFNTSVSNTNSLSNLLNSNQNYSGWVLTDTTGSHSLTGGDFPQEFKDRLIRQASQTTDGFSFILESAPNGSRIYLIAQLIRSDGENIKALLVADKFRMLDDLYSDNSSLGDSGESFLSDHNGRPLTALRYPFHSGNPIDAQAMKSCLSGKNESFMITPDYADVSTAMSYRQVTGYGGCIMVHMHADEVLLPIVRLRNLIVAINAFMLLLVIILGSLGVRKLKRDITVRKLAEERLRKSEENYRTLFENMLDGYSQCRMLFEHGVPKDFMYLNVNSQFEKLTGLKDVIGCKVSEVIPDIIESNPELFEICGRVALTGNPEKFETHIESLKIWFSVSVYSSEKEHFVAVFQDITERKQFEQELIGLNNRLSEEVSQRTSELSALAAHVQNVAETEKANLARELHDELGSTLVGLSMEVRRLVGKITTPEHLQILSTVKELISNAANIKQNIINQLYPTDLEELGFVTAVDILVEEFRSHSGIKIELVMPKENIVMEHSLSLAAYRITQECLTNIAKHAEASKVHIEVKTSDGFLYMTIHDNGRGLPNNIKTKGHGIFGMVERSRFLGGSLEMKSEVGKGTTAHLVLPLATIISK